MDNSDHRMFKILGCVVVMIFVCILHMEKKKEKRYSGHGITEEEMTWPTLEVCTLYCTNEHNKNEKMSQCINQR